jgi:hypothetical protein
MSKAIKRLCCIALLLAALGLVAAHREQAQAAEEAGNLLEGTVVETLNADGYTYVCINSNGQNNWAVTRGTLFEIGEEVEIASGSMSTEFTSASLGRTFDTIIFTNRIAKR